MPWKPRDNNVPSLQVLSHAPKSLTIQLPRCWSGWGRNVGEFGQEPGKGRHAVFGAKAQRPFDDLDATDLTRIVRAMAGALGKRAA